MADPDLIEAGSGEGDAVGFGGGGGVFDLGNGEGVLPSTGDIVVTAMPM